MKQDDRLQRPHSGWRSSRTVRRSAPEKGRGRGRHGHREDVRRTIRTLPQDLRRGGQRQDAASLRYRSGLCGPQDRRGGHNLCQSGHQRPRERSDNRPREAPGGHEGPERCQDSDRVGEIRQKGCGRLYRDDRIGGVPLQIPHRGRRRFLHREEEHLRTCP